MTMRETIEEECAYEEQLRTEGIAAERAAVVAWLRRVAIHGERTWQHAGSIECGAHHPAHATALPDALDRARSEVLAGIVEARESYESFALHWRRGDALDWLREQDIPGADALKRMLAAAKEEGRNEMRREKEQLVTYTASEVARREREARAAALVEAASIASAVATKEQATTSRRMGRGWEALVVAERIRKAALRAAGERGGALEAAIEGEP